MARIDAMKVLLISQYFHPEPFSNGDIARALVKRGHEVDVICCVPNYPEGRFYAGYDNRRRRRELWEGVHVVRARTIPRGKSTATLMFNYLAFPPAALMAWWRSRMGRHDVTFTSMPSPILQALVPTVIRALRGTPSVYWVQDIWPDSLINTLGLRNPLVCGLLAAFCSWLYKRADVVLIQSEAFRPKLEAMGVAPERIRYFPNTSAETSPEASPAAPEDDAHSALPAAKLRLMFAGNVGASQNLDVFIEAAGRLSPELGIQWVIVGDGRDLARVREQVEHRGLTEHFVFTGRRPMNAMPLYYSVADAMLVSLKDTEIFRMTVPFKLQSYMAFGKPIIGSIGGEAQRMIRQADAGFCAEPECVDEFVTAIETFAAASPAARAAMGARGARFFAEQYAPEKVYGMLEDALTAAASSRR